MCTSFCTQLSLANTAQSFIQCASGVPDTGMATSLWPPSLASYGVPKQYDQAQLPPPTRAVGNCGMQAATLQVRKHAMHAILPHGSWPGTHCAA